MDWLFGCRLRAVSSCISLLEICSCLSSLFFVKKQKSSWNIYVKCVEQRYSQLFLSAPAAGRRQNLPLADNPSIQFVGENYWDYVGSVLLKLCNDASHQLCNFIWHAHGRNFTLTRSFLKHHSLQRSIHLSTSWCKCYVEITSTTVTFMFLLIIGIIESLLRHVSVCFKHSIVPYMQTWVQPSLRQKTKQHFVMLCNNVLMMQTFLSMTIPANVVEMKSQLTETL